MRSPFLFLERICKYPVDQLRKSAFMEFLGLAGRTAIVVSVISFVWNYRSINESQKRARHYQAWQVINMAYGRSGSAGRVDALEDLLRDGVSLDFIDLSGKVDLSSANLSGADMFGANLSEATLDRVTLRGAYLSGAVFRDADMYLTKLSKADLSGTDLSGATMVGADLTGANLSGAIFSGTDLTETKLAGADMSEGRLVMRHGRRYQYGKTDLRGAKGLTCERLRVALHWEEAIRDADLACNGKTLP